MKIINKIQKIVGKITNKHCNECFYKINSRCFNITFKGKLCRQGVYPIGYVKKQ